VGQPNERERHHHRHRDAEALGDGDTVRREPVYATREPAHPLAAAHDLRHARTHPEHPESHDEARDAGDLNDCAAQQPNEEARSQPHSDAGGQGEVRRHRIGPHRQSRQDSR